MNRLKKYYKELHLSYDIIISVLGVALIIFLILALLHPEKRWFAIIAFTAGGSINIVNGLKSMKDKKNRNFAISYIFFGILVVLLGFIFFR